MADSARPAHDADSSFLDTVCNLPPEDRDSRIAMVRRELWPLVTHRTELPDGMRLDFPYSNALEETLRQLVSFERTCCSSLTWELERTSSKGLTLSVLGVPSTSQFFAPAEESVPSRPPGVVKRIAQSIGLGASAALFLCCIAPMALAAIVGVSIAAPLAQLDNPLMIAAGSILLAIPAWLWLKRRTEGSDCGC